MNALYLPPGYPFRGFWRAIQLGAIYGSLFVAGGCQEEPESHAVSTPPPPAPAVAAPTAPTSTVVAAPGGTPVVVAQAPPAPQLENPHSQPAPDEVWVPGYWTWRDDQYQWVPGHWQVPPHETTHWMPPYWEEEGTGYRYYEGYWK